MRDRRASSSKLHKVSCSYSINIEKTPCQFMAFFCTTIKSLIVKIPILSKFIYFTPSLQVCRYLIRVLLQMIYEFLEIALDFLLMIYRKMESFL